MAVKIEILPALSSEQTYKELGLSPKWFPKIKVGAKFKMIPYFDARDVQTLLDHVCGAANWQNEPRNINGKLYMGIGINIENEGWVWKFDIGTESNVEKEKGESSDAMKRAAVNWGIFRHVYYFDEILLPIAADQKHPMTANGTVLLTKEQISNYCNGINNGAAKLGTIYSQYKPQIESNSEVLEAVKVLGKFLKQIKE
jgi:hypothetical protein